VLVLLAAGALLLGAQQIRSARLPFREPFDGTALGPGWSVLNPALATVTVAGGALRVVPNQGGLGTIWFEDAEGALVHRTVTGDFTAITRAQARAAGGSSQPPPAPYRLGGLLARAPGSAPGARDSVHVALGSGVTDAPPFAPVCAEDKTTNDSSSVFVLHPIASPDGDLRLRRRGSSFELAYRPIGVPQWTVLATHVRADLPATLHVGLMAYSAPSPPDLELVFERFELLP
jgi:hypothetical protein